MDDSILRVALAQHACDIDPDKNLQRSVEMIRRASQQRARLILLPELHRTRYFCQSENTEYFQWAEPIPGPSTEALGEVARETNMVVVASLFERRASGLYHNTAVVIERDGSVAGRYRKMHIPDDPGFYEKFYFTPGDLGFTPIDTSVGRLGVLVCWDQWYPEAARLMSLAGAQILLYPTAIGWDPRDNEDERSRQYEAWRTVQRGHAVANALPVMVCNRVGIEADESQQTSGIHFWGASFCCGPQGEVLTQTGHVEEELAIVDIDMARCEQVRRIWPFLRDRRIDAYDDILKRYRDHDK